MLILGLVGGLILMIVGAEILVRGASRIAANLGISPLVIGLTVVAFGTSSPELAVSITSSISGNQSIAVGNIVGSNIFNTLFILGISAVIAPLIVNQKLVRLDVPILIGVSFLVLVMGLDGRISQLDGFLLFCGLIAYTVYLIWESRLESREIQEEYAHEYAAQSRPDAREWVINLVFIAGGLGMLVLGSDWLVDSSVAIAQQLGVSQTIIGLTLVAAGTSLPEVATSVIASLRNERDIAVGNVIGSNLFNLLGVLGLSGLLAPQGVAVEPAVLAFDLPVMLATAVACLPVFFASYRIARWEGALFFGYYLAYTLYLILQATQHDSLRSYSVIMLEFALPLTIVTLIVVVVQRSRRLGQS